MMLNRMVTVQQIKQGLFRTLLSLVLLSLAGCDNPLREPSIGPAQAPTELPTETPLEPTETLVAMPTETPVGPTETPTPTDGQLELPEVRLPQSALERLKEVAEANDLEFLPLAAENTVIYALPEGDGGVVFLLTPTTDPAGFSSKELATNPGAFAKRVIGGLTVVRQVNVGLPALPPDDYVITIAPSGRKVVFTGAKARLEFNAVIRWLPQLPRPVALISASQMCLAWDTTQICALAESPLPEELVARLREAIKNLSAEERDFALERSVPDIEGVDGLQRCAAALNPVGELSEPNYANCWATVLSTPTLKDVALKDQPGQVAKGIGLLVVLEEINEEVYSNPELTEPVEPVPTYPPRQDHPVGVLPQGDFYVSEVRRDDDPQIGDGIFETRVRLSGEGRDFYLPSISGGVIVGNRVQGSGPSGENEAVITNLWIRGRCFFKWRQCRWYY